MPMGRITVTPVILGREISTGIVIVNVSLVWMNHESAGRTACPERAAA
jgi:hypothetical protein